MTPDAPAPFQFLHPAAYRVTPWKDGGGTTTQIAIEPPGATVADPFVWRLSSARVEGSGPFSRFPGTHRILALLEGPGMELVFEDGRTLRLDDPLAPVAFPGDLGVHATLLGGPCVDLGLIYDPARVACQLSVLALGAEPVPLDLRPTTLLFAPRGDVFVDQQRLHPFEGQRWDQPGTCELRGEGPQALLVVCKVQV